MILSVIVPVYNTALYLRGCIDSIIKQSRRPDELILVDDGSTDGSGDICKEYAQRYDWIYTIHQANQGLSMARNAGLEAANGDWVSFVDSDDWVDSDMYADMCLLAEENQADIISSGIWIDCSRHRYSRFDDKRNECFNWDRVEALRQLMSFRYLDMSVCNKLFRRELFCDIRFPEGRINEDLWTSYRLISAADSMIHTTRAYYHYRQSDDSTTRPQTDEKKRRYLTAWEQEAEGQLRFIEQSYPQAVREAKTFCAFTQIGICNYCVRNNFMEGSNLHKARSRVFRTLGDIVLNRRLPNIKKLQAIVFVCAPKIYKKVIMGHDHR